MIFKNPRLPYSGATGTSEVTLTLAERHFACQRSYCNREGPLKPQQARMAVQWLRGGIAAPNREEGGG